MRVGVRSFLLSATSACSLLLAGCGEKAPEAASESAASSVPGISPSAAPGVAFNYHYDFALPDKAIAGVQEQHAAACEKLGPERCRITGMHYALVRNDSVSASLEFKLAPDLARAFGKEGIAAVEHADGKLIRAAIEGQDVGSDIAAAQKRGSDAQADLNQIEAKLAKGGLGDRERAELNQQAGALRAKVAAERDAQTTGAVRLASTPMTFTYAGGGSFVWGDNPFAGVAQASWSSLRTMVALVVFIVGIGAPWLALLIALLVLWRVLPIPRLRRFLLRKTEDE